MFAELMRRSLDERRAAYADPAWRERRCMRGLGRAGPLGPRWDTYAIDRSRPRIRSWSAARSPTSPPSAASDPFDALLDLALDEPDLSAAGQRRSSPTTTPTRSPRCCVDEHCTLGLSDAGAHVGQLCDAPQATDFLGNWVRDRDA